MKKLFCGVLLCAASPLAAQSGTDLVSAKEPTSISRLLTSSGYQIEAVTLEDGRPVIATEVNGFSIELQFSGCDSALSADCDSIMLVSSFDRAEPWTAEEAIAVNKQFRFVAISLDDEGDPLITWDIVTGDGIPAQVLLTSLDYFGSALQDSADLIFAAELEKTPE